MAEPSGPLVDVGIPTCERPDYVVEAIESVLAQKFDRWRMVISDNSSTEDAVAPTLQPYLKDPRINYARPDTRVEAADNMTRLINAGSAPYVALLHDDDRWEDPGFLERRVDFLEANPDCGFVFSGNVEIDGDGRETRQRPLVPREGVHPSAEFVPRLLEHNVVPIPTVLVRRSAYEAVGPAYDPRFDFIFDWEMWLRLAIQFPVGCLDVQDAAYRIHGSQKLFHRRWSTIFLDFLDHADALLEDKPPSWRLSDRRSRQVRSGWHLSAALDAIEERDRRAVFPHLRAAVRLHRWALVDPKMPVAVGGLVLGPLGPRAVAYLRSFVHRRRNWLRRSR